MSTKIQHRKFDLKGKTYLEVDEEFDDGFKVTGFYYNSTRRFSSKYKNSHIALNINLWRGNVYGMRKDGSKQVIKSVYN